MNSKRLIMFMPIIETGGIGKNFIIISNYFSQKLKDVTIVTATNSFKYKFSKKLIFISQNFINLKKFPRRIIFLIGLILLAKELLKNRNSIVFCFQANLYCIYLCKLLNVKVIARSGSSPTGWPKNPIKRMIYKNGYSLANELIVNSKESKSLIRKIFKLNTTQIYNPLNTNEIYKLSKKKIKFNFFDKVSFNFIYVARLENEKDHFTLLNAFLKIKNKINFKLLLIGDGKNKKEIKSFIIQNNLEKNIMLLSNIDNPYPYIKKSKIVLLTSLYEGLPNILLEGIFFKKLIISSICSTGPKEILDSGKGGLLFKKGNVNDLIKKLISLKKNNFTYKVNFAHKRLLRFDYKANLNKYMKIVNKQLIQ